MQKQQSKAISMPVTMDTEDGLRRGAIMVITKKIGLACADLLYHKNIFSVMYSYQPMKKVLQVFWTRGSILLDITHCISTLAPV